MEHQSSNKNKSINGNKFEQLFTKLTGLVKENEENKPRFINEHGLVQKIDYDFKTVIDGVEVFIDTTTTHRSCRLKQKSYNGLCSKLYLDRKTKFYVVVKSFTEKDGTKKNPVLIQGVDKVIEIDEFMEIFNKQ
jgi:hypothetical protein